MGATTASPQSHPKSFTPKSLEMFPTIPPPPPSSVTTTTKIKTIIHNLIVSHICRVARALSKAKSVFLEFLRESHRLLYLQNQSHTRRLRKKKYRNKVLFGSFRLHYNWCSSSAHILPMPSPAAAAYRDDVGGISSGLIYYDSTWNSVFSTHDDRAEEDDGGNLKADHDKERQLKEGQQQQGWSLHDSDAYSELSSYLQWLEEKGDEKSNPNSKMNEIDMLADMFIKNCHEKFRLEKIESYRRYQEMLARSM